MSKTFAAAHEAGHGFLWHYAGVAVCRVEIHPEPAMGDEEWEGTAEPDREQAASTDRIWAILAAYAGPLAEAKRRAEVAVETDVMFDYSADEADFICGVFSDVGTGMTRVSFVGVSSGAPYRQPLLLASIRSDVVGNDEHPGAYTLAQQVQRLDVLVPLCRLIRRFLDHPAVWHTIRHFAHELEERLEITSPHVGVMFQQLFEQETALAAHDLWIDRERQLWDDQRDWFCAQGRTLVLETIPLIVAGHA